MPPTDKVIRGNREGKCPSRSQRAEKSIHHCQAALKFILKTQAALSKYIE